MEYMSGKSSASCNADPLARHFYFRFRILLERRERSVHMLQIEADRFSLEQLHVFVPIRFGTKRATFIECDESDAVFNRS